MNASTEPAVADEKGHTLSDVEPVLFDMRSAIAMLRHMADSGLDIEADHLGFVETQLVGHHQRLHEMWRSAFRENCAERARLEADKERLTAELEKTRREIGPPAASMIWGGQTPTGRSCARLPRYRSGPATLASTG